MSIIFRVRDLQPRAPLLGRRPKPRYSNNDKPASTRDPLRKVALKLPRQQQRGGRPLRRRFGRLARLAPLQKNFRLVEKKRLRLKNFFAKKFWFFSSRANFFRYAGLLGVKISRALLGRRPKRRRRGLSGTRFKEKLTASNFFRFRKRSGKPRLFQNATTKVKQCNWRKQYNS